MDNEYKKNAIEKFWKIYEIYEINGTNKELEWLESVKYSKLSYDEKELSDITNKINNIIKL